MTLLPPDKSAAFVTDGITPTGWDWRWRSALKWRGSNQFEVEDNRKAFLAAFRDTLLNMTENLPSELLDVRRVTLEGYDSPTGMLSLDVSANADLPWSRARDGLTIAAPLPLLVPANWKLSDLEARKVIEQADVGIARIRPDLKSGSGTDYHQAIVALRYAVREIRPEIDGITLDLAAIDIKIYDAADFAVELGTIPLPEGAVLANPPASVATDAPVFLDAMYPRLLASSLDPSLASSSTFVRETFDLRRIQERQMRTNSNAMPTNWPLIIGAPLLETTPSREPSTKDLQQVAIWIQQHSTTLNRSVRLPVAGFFGSKGGTNVDLRRLVEFSGDFSGSDRSWIDDAMAESKKLLPDSVDFKILWSGNEVPTIVAFHPDPSWFGVEFPVAPDGAKGSVSIDIVDASFQATANGKRFLLLDVRPTKINYASASGEVTIELGDVSTKSEDAGSTYDIAGAKLGMKLDDAVAAVKMFVGPESVQHSEERPDPVLRNAIVVQRNRSSEFDPAERVSIFYRTDGEDRTVILIGRLVQMDDFETDEEARGSFIPRLEQKFGKSTKAYASSDVYWTTDAVTKGKLKAGLRSDDVCSNFHYENLLDNDRKSVFRANSEHVTVNCGEVFSAHISQSRATFFLTSTNELRKVKEAVAASMPAPVEKGLGVKF